MGMFSHDEMGTTDWGAYDEIYRLRSALRVAIDSLEQLKELGKEYASGGVIQEGAENALKEVRARAGKGWI